MEEKKRPMYNVDRQAYYKDSRFDGWTKFACLLALLLTILALTFRE